MAYSSLKSGFHVGFSTTTGTGPQAYMAHDGSCVLKQISFSGRGDVSTVSTLEWLELYDGGVIDGSNNRTSNAANPSTLICKLYYGTFEDDVSNEESGVNIPQYVNFPARGIRFDSSLIVEVPRPAAVPPVGGNKHIGNITVVYEY